MIVIIAFSVLFLMLGAREKAQNQKNIDAIPVRIVVNGIRGKSTVTRLMTGALAEGGYKVVGKTTGTAARMIFWNNDEELAIERRPEGANISEQKKVTAHAVKLGADVLVSECMAVNPDYQIVFQEQLLQANIGVIVNVAEDHMEVMGPTLDNVAEAFTATIPYDGKLIIAAGPYEQYFRKIAEERRTEIIVADTAQINEDQLKAFSYVVFPENVALALALAKALNVSEAVAWRGMLRANPDPGILKIHTINVLGEDTYFVNAFAANDATSTLAIWQRVKDLGYPTDKVAVIMNCRQDRMDRTMQFAEDVLPLLPAELFICMGEGTKPVRDAYHKGIIITEEFITVKGEDGFAIYKEVEERIAGKVIFGVGNIHGTAEEFIEALLRVKPEGEKLCTGQNYTSPL
jgi:poly-gamma-glutamate synthase PgsB/CapB